MNEELKAKVSREKDLAVQVDTLLTRSEATSLRLDNVKQQLAATKEEVARREQEEGEGGKERVGAASRDASVSGSANHGLGGSF